jgi:hypothetical protein
VKRKPSWPTGLIVSAAVVCGLSAIAFGIILVLIMVSNFTSAAVHDTSKAPLRSGNLEVTVESVHVAGAMLERSPGDIRFSSGSDLLIRLKLRNTHRTQIVRVTGLHSGRSWSDPPSLRDDLGNTYRRIRF